MNIFKTFPIIGLTAGEKSLCGGFLCDGKTREGLTQDIAVYFSGLTVPGLSYSVDMIGSENVGRFVAKVNYSISTR